MFRKIYTESIRWEISSVGKYHPLGNIIRWEISSVGKYHPLGNINPLSYPIFK